MNNIPLIYLLTAMIIIIIVFNVIAFYPSLNNGFTNWDDNATITENPRIKDLSFTRLVVIFTTTYHGGYEPLTELSFALEYHFLKSNNIHNNIYNMKVFIFLQRC